MSVEPSQPVPHLAGAARILARARRAETRDHQRVLTAIDDFFLPAGDRLDDRTRAALGEAVAAMIGAVERDLLAHARRDADLAAAPDAAPGEAPDTGGVLPRLLDAGVLRDRTLMAELGGRTRLDLLAAALEASVPRDEQSALLARLTACPDGIVSAAATDLFVAESRRRTASRCDLPHALHERIVWWVAAALREAAGEGASTDRALADAARRALAAHDDDDRVEAAALRLAAAIDARPAELAELLVDSLADARPALFVAVIAQAAGLGFAEARAIVLDPDADRLWLVLRAHGLPRERIARVGLLLADADPRRDLEAFADALDAIVAIESGHAADAIAPMRLHPDFRAAVRALGEARPA